MVASGATVTVTSSGDGAVGLDEIVVTGTAGATQKRAIGNAVTQMRAAEVLMTPVASISECSTRAAGVIFMPQTGQVGQRDSIRGASSMNLDNEPLVMSMGSTDSELHRQRRAGGPTFDPEDIGPSRSSGGPRRLCTGRRRPTA
jgi:hypothetical protein